MKRGESPDRDSGALQKGNGIAESRLIPAVP